MPLLFLKDSKVSMRMFIIDGVNHLLLVYTCSCPLSIQKYGWKIVCTYICNIYRIYILTILEQHSNPWKKQAEFYQTLCALASANFSGLDPLTLHFLPLSTQSFQLTVTSQIMPCSFSPPALKCAPTAWEWPSTPSPPLAWSVPLQPAALRVNVSP